MSISPSLDATSTATLGLLRASNRVATDAEAIARGGTGNGTTAAPLTGGQPNNSASQVFQALQGGGGPDLLASVVDLVAARTNYQANADVLNTSNALKRQAIDIIS